MNQIIKGYKGPQSQLFFVLFNSAPQAWDKIFFQNDSELDRSIVTGLKIYSDDSGGGNFSFNPTYEVNGIVYTVLSLASLNSFTLTLVNKQRQQILSQYPLVLLDNLSTVTNSNAVNQTNFSCTILTGECFINVTPFIVLPVPPFCIPIEVFYKYKG